MFKEGEYVRVKYHLNEIEGFVGGYVSSMSEYSGNVYRIKKAYGQGNGYLLEDTRPYIWDERALEYPNNIKEDKKVDKIKNVSFDEVILTRKDLNDAYMSVAIDLIENPPKEFKGDFKSAMILSLSVPVIGNMIADRLFGKEEDKEE